MNTKTSYYKMYKMKYLLICFLIFTVTLMSQNNENVKKDFKEWLIKASKQEKENIISLDTSKSYLIVFSSVVPYSSIYFQQVVLQEDADESISEFSNYQNIVARNDTLVKSDLPSLNSGFFYPSLTSFGDEYYICRGTQIHYHGGQISYGTTFTYYFEVWK